MRKVVFTEIEKEAVRAVVQFGTIQAAADHLGLSREGLDSRLDRLRIKTGLRHTPQLVAFAALQGWVGEVAFG